MRLKTAAMLAGVAVAAATAGWFGALEIIPRHATDRMWSQFQKAGMKLNRLSPARIRTAKTAKVVADNADTLTRSAIIDLSDGPMLFTAEIPGDDRYWSVSLFAHNTDTFFVANDQTVGPGPYRLLIRERGQAGPAEAEADDVAVSPSRRAFLIIRAVMRDRNDPAEAQALQAQVMASQLEPVR
ncbi:DUF1254 domain-containing protein [Phenylobacterium sp. SCN 70-31]|uniref:DUF1254 domain-containing protein n=1 Tax=Phenylobacterium sp. SCN 70-31 TaxID=1660129 RepID=UPI00086C6E31|nr:DUF1254 domain-containing protein [Phenylobacterium sp. SCN 70-31]ODT86128.1 MAG: hypothetical protein ABS78_17495 [Phenylobacterium sp. SCN 70-31]